MSQISKIYQDSHFRKQVHVDLNTQQQQAYLKPKRKKKKVKKTGRKRIKIDHSLCEVAVRACGPHQGLYCVKHNTWIKWISKRDLAKIQDLV